MQVHKRRRTKVTKAETDRLLKDIQEELKQLRLATQMYTAVVERILTDAARVENAGSRVRNRPSAPESDLAMARHHRSSRSNPRPAPAA
jgi:hypothetical protein